MAGKSLRNRKMNGGTSAAQYGSAIFPGGAVSQLDMNTASNASAGANQIHALNPAQVWTGGKGKGKKMGGSAAPAPAPAPAPASNDIASTPYFGPNNVAITASKFGGSRKNKNSKIGGTLLVDIAVPAALVYTNQVYPRKNKSKKSRSNSKKSSRRYRRK